MILILLHFFFTLISMILLHFWLPFVGCPASAVTVHLAVNLSYDRPYCLLMVGYAENERWKKNPCHRFLM